MFAYEVLTEDDESIHPKAGEPVFAGVSGEFRPITFTKSGHGLSNGQQVRVSGVVEQTDLTSIVKGQSYYVVGVDGDAFQLSPTLNGLSLAETATEFAPVSFSILPEGVHSYRVDEVEVLQTPLEAKPYEFTVVQAIKDNELVRVEFDGSLPGFPTSGEIYRAKAVPSEPTAPSDPKIQVFPASDEDVTNQNSTPIEPPGADLLFIGAARLTAFMPFGENAFEYPPEPSAVDYDASTNTPNLDDSPAMGDIQQGNRYRVTEGGDFFTTAVTPGQILVASQDDPTSLAHWSIEAPELIPEAKRPRTE